MNIKAKTWKRAGDDSRRRAGQRHFLPTDMHEYYERIYWFLRDAGLEPLGKTEEFTMYCEFHFTDRGWRDTLNLQKAVEDAGQASKWYKDKRKLNMPLVMPDLWDDRIFSDSHGRRFRGSDSDRIMVRICKV